MSVSFKTPIDPPVEDPKPAASSKGGEMKSVIAALRKSHGEKLIMPGSSIPTVRRIPTGMFEFDYATGGGFPRGRISIVYGPESSGKTNTCYLAAATAQKLPPPCNVVVWVDLEGTFDPKWAAKFGVNVEDLVLVKPGFGEEAVDAIEALVYAEECALLAVDSVAALTPAKEVEGEAGDQHPGRGAMLAKRLCNKVAVALSVEGRRGHDPAVILINQTRFKIGVLHGDPETMPGGQTMKFLSSLTVRLYGKDKIVKEVNPELPAFKETHAVIKKAKVGIIQKAFDFDMSLMPATGIPIGGTNSWTTVSNHLKQLGLLGKVDKGQGWAFAGAIYPTLAPIQDKYLTEKAFRLMCQQKVVDALQSVAVLVEEK